MSWPLYWLSASVLTTTSAPSLSAASSPAWKPEARPLLFVSRTMWSTPWALATSTVASVEPSSMTSHSTSSKPETWRGRSRSVVGSVCSSLRQGIWMMSFIGAVESTRPAGRGYGAIPSAHGGDPVDAAAARRPLARARRAGVEGWARIAFVALCVATAIGTLVYPTYPNYDSYYSLLWAREVVHGTLPNFEGFRMPTEHPLAILAACCCSRSATAPTASGSR